MSRDRQNNTEISLAQAKMIPKNEISANTKICLHPQKKKSPGVLYSTNPDKWDERPGKSQNTTKEIEFESSVVSLRKMLLMSTKANNKKIIK